MAESKETPRARLTLRLLACTPEEFIANYKNGKFDNRPDIASMIETLLLWYPELKPNV